MFIHDLIYRDHDKDYRFTSALPHPVLRKLAVAVVRVSFHREATVEVVDGEEGVS